MPYLLLGPDDYSKKIFVSSLVEKLGAELAVFGADDMLPKLSELSQTDLFSKPKVFLFQGVMPDFSAGVPNLEASKNQIVISIASLDKRKKENKDLLANKLFEVTQFELPHGKDLDGWLINRAKELGSSINPKAANALAIALGRDDAKETKVAGKVVASEEIYNLWQAENELKIIGFG
jgi:DNA polymerase III delta subunit